MHGETDDTAKISAADSMQADAQAKDMSEEISDAQLLRALRDGARRERLLFGNEELMNAVIGRYLEELSGTASVPVVRGFSALSPVRKPRTLAEAKAIVDGK